MEVGQQYDTIYNSARHNQLLFLLTSVAKTLCENGMMPFLAGQEYSQYARCIFTDGKLYTASRAILANEQPYPTPGDDSGVWITEETSKNLVPNSRRVIAGTGLTGGGPLSSDVTLSAKLDGKTTQAAANGAITVKDVAINGDLGDLASARGQIGELKVAKATEYPSILTIRKSCKLFFSGTEWAKVADRPFASGYGAVVITNVSSSTLRGEIWASSLSGNEAWKAQFSEKGTSPFARFVMSNAIGDGIRVTNGIISVPKYDGATASTSGTSGLVPPATAGQQESFLTGGGEYKPALTKISDSVSLKDSTTAASATAVKTAYDLASSKQPNLGFTPVQQGGGTGQGRDKIYIGYSKSGLKAQAGTLDLGNVVTTSTGCTKAPSAALADNATNARNLVVTPDGQTAKFNWTGRYTGQPEWVWGGNAAEFGNMYTWNPSNFSVNYANSAGSATGLTYTFTTNNSLVLPPGGTWFVLSWWDGDGGSAKGNWSGGQIVAGGSSVGVSNGAFALRVA